VDGDASFVTAVSSAYASTGSIIFELPDGNTQPIERHVYLSFVTPGDTDKNDASIQFYFENKDEVDKRNQGKPSDPVKSGTSMFYNPSAVQNVYNDDKFSSYSIDEILNLYSYKDITEQNTKQTYVEILLAEAQEYRNLVDLYQDDPILSPSKPNSITSIAFGTHCDVTPEEKNIPLFLLPKENNFIAAYRGQLYHRLNTRSQGPAIFCPFLGFQTTDIIKKTLENTTQLAQMVINQPLQKHYSARFPQLNKPRIDEMVSVDSFETNV